MREETVAGFESFLEIMDGNHPSTMLTGYTNERTESATIVKSSNQLQPTLCIMFSYNL